MSHKPSLLSVSICDDVIEDKRSGKKSLIGLFTTMNVARVPAHANRFCIFFSMSGGEGEMPVQVRILGPDGQVVFDLNGRARFASPGESLDSIIEVRGLRIPLAGMYTVTVSVGDETPHTRSFEVLSSKKGGDDNGGDARGATGGPGVVSA